MTTAGKATRVLVFAKAPRAGAVKTRLVPLLGAAGAAAFHADMIEHTLRVACEADIGPIDLYGSPATDEFLTCSAARFGAELHEQAGANLGDRMYGAFAQALRNSAHAVLIGCDCPAMSPRYLRSAADALGAGNDAVFGPVEDGGYALIGLSRATRSLFDGVPWGTEHVMSTTRARVMLLGWTWAELEPLWDVDRPADFQRLQLTGTPWRRRALTS